MAHEGKIALEEHFVLPETLQIRDDAEWGADYAAAVAKTSVAFGQQIQDLGSGRIAEMDRGGVELAVLSLGAPGVQAIPDVSRAIAASRRANDYLAEHIAKFPARLKGFAALPLQDPGAATAELARCVKDLGFRGALVNGFSDLGESGSVAYYDVPRYRTFWAAVQDLDVPVYLHPRSPTSTRQPAYEGHPWLAGSVWGFAAETSLHALRLMGSGLFDEYPKLRLILGHLGEGLPFNIWRADHRLSRQQRGHGDLGMAARRAEEDVSALSPRARRPLAQYLRENFYTTTSGNFRTSALANAIAEVGIDRVVYSVDYPFEDMVEAADWFDTVPLGDADRHKIARINARTLLGL